MEKINNIAAGHFFKLVIALLARNVPNLNKTAPSPTHNLKPVSPAKKGLPNESKIHASSGNDTGNSHTVPQTTPAWSMEKLNNLNIVAGHFLVIAPLARKTTDKTPEDSHADVP